MSDAAAGMALFGAEGLLSCKATRKLFMLSCTHQAPLHNMETYQCLNCGRPDVSWAVSRRQQHRRQGRASSKVLLEPIQSLSVDFTNEQMPLGLGSIKSLHQSAPIPAIGSNVRYKQHLGVCTPHLASRPGSPDHFGPAFFCHCTEERVQIEGLPSEIGHSEARPLRFKKGRQLRLKHLLALRHSVHIGFVPA